MEAAKNCTVNLWNEQGWELDDGMLKFVFERVVLHHILQAKSIDIYPQEREAMELSDTKKYFSNGPGWIEWIVNIKYHGGGRLTIGCIQRTIGAEYESHS